MIRGFPTCFRVQFQLRLHIAQLDICTNLAGVQLMDEKLLDSMRWLVLAKHCSYRTAKAYVHRARRYILFHDLRHPRDMGMMEVETFRTHLTVDCHLAAATHNQTLSVIFSLYRKVHALA